MQYATTFTVNGDLIDVFDSYDRAEAAIDSYEFEDLVNGAKLWNWTKRYRNAIKITYQAKINNDTNKTDNMATIRHHSNYERAVQWS